MTWGAIQTSAEVQGVAQSADWSPWIREGRAPDPGLAGTRPHHTADLELLRSLGCSTLVLTAEWARLCPAAGKYQEDELQRLRAALTATSAAGIEPWLCLVDGTLPGWFAIDRNGFRDDECRNLIWPRHVNWVAENLGDLVAGWIPQREPIHWALKSHYLGLAPPGLRDSQKTEEMVRGRLLADFEAARVLRGSIPVAAFHTARLVRPQRNPDNPEENVAAAAEARWLEDLGWCWMAALTEGTLNVGSMPESRIPDHGSFFTRFIVQLRPAVKVAPDGAWLPVRDPPLLIGLEDALGRVVDHVGSGQLVVATDLAPLPDDAAARTDHLNAVRSLASDLGVEWWAASPISGWHWENGYTVQPGVISRAREAMVDL